MELIDIATGGRPFVESYGDGGFGIGGQRHLGSVIVLGDRVLAWAVTRGVDITVAGLAPVIEAVIEARPELLLIGCGECLTPIPPASRGALRDARIALEPMATGAACRTFNLLLSEGRRVAAALIAVARDR